MSRNLLILNCNDFVIHRLRQELGEVEVTCCQNFEDLRAAWDRYRHARVIVGCNGQDTPSSAEGGAPHNRQNGHAAVGEPSNGFHASHTPPAAATEKSLAEQVDEFEREVIAETLRRNHQHRKETAAALGISRVTLYNKMKKFGLFSV